MCRNDSITMHICSTGPPGRAVLAVGVEGLYPQPAEQRLRSKTSPGPASLGPAHCSSWWEILGAQGKPIPAHPFTSSQIVGRADVTGPRVSSDLPTLNVTASVRVLLGLASTFHPFQLYPVSSTWACSVSWTVL